MNARLRRLWDSAAIRKWCKALFSFLLLYTRVLRKFSHFASIHKKQFEGHDCMSAAIRQGFKAIIILLLLYQMVLRTFLHFCFYMQGFVASICKGLTEVALSLLLYTKVLMNFEGIL